jgi:hypothetical protein
MLAAGDAAAAGPGLAVGVGPDVGLREDVAEARGVVSDIDDTGPPAGARLIDGALLQPVEIVVLDGLGERVSGKFVLGPLRQLPSGLKV